MSNSKQATSGWTATQAYVMAVLCLLVGIAVGYLARGSSGEQQAPTGSATQAAAEMGANGMPQITPEQLKHMVNKQAEPLLQELKSKPNDSALLASIGNVYYDAQQYQDAISYYERSLKVQPANTNVRTDMATAFWYAGDADRAIAEFQTVLKAEPTKANALFNMGIVQWQGKMDVNAASAAWQKLLDTNPNYDNKEKVVELLAQVKRHSGIKPGTKTDKPAM